MTTLLLTVLLLFLVLGAGALALLPLFGVQVPPELGGWAG